MVEPITNGGEARIFHSVLVGALAGKNLKCQCDNNLSPIAAGRCEIYCARGM